MSSKTDSLLEIIMDEIRKSVDPTRDWDHPHVIYVCCNSSAQGVSIHDVLLKALEELNCKIW